MRKLALALGLLLLSSCSYDTLRPNCVYKTVSLNIKFTENPFVSDMDLYGVGKAFKTAPSAPKKINSEKTLITIMVDNIKIMTHEFDLQIEETYSAKSKASEYSIIILPAPNQYYKCSRPESFIASDLKQIVGRIPLKPAKAQEVYKAVNVETVDSKKLDIY